MSKYFISDKCVRCKSCESDCPVQAIKDFFINQSLCIHCGDCYEICPVGAIIRADDKNFLAKIIQAC